MTARNVLLINVDHWPSDIGHREHSAVLTPTLDELVRCGTLSLTPIRSAPSAFRTSHS